MVRKAEKEYFFLVRCIPLHFRAFANFRYRKVFLMQNSRLNFLLWFFAESSSKPGYGLSFSMSIERWAALVLFNPLQNKAGLLWPMTCQTHMEAMAVGPSSRECYIKKPFRDKMLTAPFTRQMGYGFSWQEWQFGNRPNASSRSHGLALQAKLIE